MDQLKRIISFTLCLLLLFSFSTINANATTPAIEAGNYLKGIGVFQGDSGTGNLRLEDHITRTEFAVIAVRIIGKANKEADYRSITAFKDVSPSFWGSGYINLAVEENLMQGDGGTKLFRPHGQITYAEATTVLLRILGYDKDLDLNNWPTSYMNKANELKITKNISINPNSPITRGDIAILIYNSLDIKIAK